MNSNFTSIDEFYPTPKALLDKVFEDIKLERVGSILEPSAGKGDICDYIEKKINPYDWSHNEVDIDCVEIDEDLRATLQGKDYRVVSDDFLAFNPYKKYDLIVMNPPFSCGDKHLLHALKLQEKGGAIICILNAETLKNAYSDNRKYLLQQLDKVNAQIEFMEHEFEAAERKTSVEIAVVKVDIPQEELESEFLDRLRTKYYPENDVIDVEETQIAENDIVNAVLKEYQIELEAGIKLINEFKGYAKRSGLLTMKLAKDAGRYSDALTVNAFIKEVNYKYWSKLFQNPKFTGKMTNEQMSKWNNNLAELQNFEFSRYNIMEVYKKMNEELIGGIENCIIKLFDDLSFQHSYYDTSNNIHYYSGWCTNSAWMVNKKVIIPYMDAYSSYSHDFKSWNVQSKLEDIEKVFDYLDGGLTEGSSIGDVLTKAEREGQTKNVRFKYFTCTFYKKGTTHLTFNKESKDLWKKFNIFGSQQKGWLPQGYGRRFYEDFSAEEKEVIDSFDGGQKGYENTLEKAEYFIYDATQSQSLPRLTA
ncbi:MAG: DUF4942 domain-containing protein [Pseudobutyrivibrio ruminis]|nr:DUF4942 domain-containing protein [Pseudobutyrivibrio ruminis]